MPNNKVLTESNLRKSLCQVNGPICHDIRKQARHKKNKNEACEVGSAAKPSGAASVLRPSLDSTAGGLLCRSAAFVDVQVSENGCKSSPFLFRYGIVGHHRIPLAGQFFFSALLVTRLDYQDINLVLQILNDLFSRVDLALEL